MHPPLFERWNSDYEVPFGLKVPSPAPTRIWRFILAEAPPRDGMHMTEPQIHAMWCATMTLYAQDVAVGLLRGIRWGELCRLPPALVEGMLSIGVQALVGGSGREADILGRALYVMRRIAWSRVDPAASTRPEENMVGAPVYQSGDKVPWGTPPDGSDDVNVCAALWLVEGARDAPLRLAEGSLKANRTPNGVGIALAAFDNDGGVRVDALHGGRAPWQWQLSLREKVRRHLAGERGRGGYRLDLADPTRGFGARDRRGGTGWIRKKNRGGRRSSRSSRGGAASSDATMEALKEQRRRAFALVWERPPTDAELARLMGVAHPTGQDAAAADAAVDTARQRRRQAFHHVWGRYPTEVELDGLLAGDAASAHGGGSTGGVGAAAVATDGVNATANADGDGGESAGVPVDAAPAGAPAVVQPPVAPNEEETPALPVRQRPTAEVAEVVTGIVDAVAVSAPETAAVLTDAASAAAGADLASQLDALRAGAAAMADEELAAELSGIIIDASAGSGAPDE